MYSQKRVLRLLLIYIFSVNADVTIESTNHKEVILKVVGEGGDGIMKGPGASGGHDTISTK